MACTLVYQNQRFSSKTELLNYLNGTTIKPGIQELFDSNPELANQVIEEDTETTLNVTEQLHQLIKADIEQQKIKQIEIAKQNPDVTLMSDFNDFFPQYSDLSNEDKIVLMQLISEGKLQVKCNL